jgi:hypothetical protein
MDDNRLKDEALLNLIQKHQAKGWNPAIIEKQYREVKLFLFQFEIKDGGPNAVPGDVIYYKYLKTKRIEDAMGRVRFTQLLKVFLKHKVSLNVPVFRIDATKVDLPEEYSFYKDPRFSPKKTRRTKYRGVRPAPWGEWMAELEYEGRQWLVGFYRHSWQAAYAWNEAVKYFRLDYKLNRIHKGPKQYDKKPKTIEDLKEMLKKRKAKERAKKRKMAKLERRKASVESS